MQLHRASVRFQRLQLTVKDALRPFLVLLTMNIILLTIWTTLSPLQWQRIPGSSVDRYGRSVDSIGICQSNNSTVESIMLALLMAINVLSLVVAIRQSYASRHLPSELNESHYIFLSIAFMLEACFLGVPLLWVAADNPMASYVVRTILAIAFSCCILGPAVFTQVESSRKNRTNRGRRVSLGMIQTPAPSRVLAWSAAVDESRVRDGTTHE